MATNVIMPSLGFDMTEGKIARWLKKEGERVDKGQAIAEIETDKATVEIEANASGVLKKIVVPPEQTVPIGTVIGVIGEPNEAVPEKIPEQAGASQTAEPPSRAPQQGGNGKEEPVAETGETRIKASPLARRMAKQAGIDLAQVRGSGPGGRIMERDIQAAQTAPKPAPAPAAAPAAQTAGSVPLNKMRQAIARRMTESKTTAPHFYVTVEIHMAEAMKTREQLNAVAADADKISVNDLIVAAAARTLVKFPNFNASFHNGALETHAQVNIGIAVALDDGLITPVLRDANKKTLKAIAAESKALGERARTNKLRADDLGAGTFTVSNLGMFGVDEFIAIINPPEAAILAAGAVTPRAIVVDGSVRAAPMMKATLSTDHRVADGAQAARFMQEFKKLLENPVNLLIG
jgi:pyruvate dehydrogenase E2 component (dihydrolipoyllysine-residue acetyltransferase)